MKKLLLILTIAMCSCSSGFQKVDVVLDYIDNKTDTLKEVWICRTSLEKGDFDYKFTETGTWQTSSYVRTVKVIKSYNIN